MNADTKVLILKLTNRDGKIAALTTSDIVKRASKDWRVTYPTVAKVEHALIMFQGVILAECTVGDKLIVNRDTGRMTFKLSLVPKSKLTRQLMTAYKAPNPISVKTYAEIQALMQQSN